MRRTRLLLLSFLAGACTMVAEVVAPRLVAPHVGTTALVWTTVIATFLGGIALGNALGGRLADAERRGALPAAFLVAAGALALSLPLGAFARTAVSEPSLAWPHALRVLLGVPLVFLLGAVGLGLVGPALGRAVLRAGGSPGRALGAVAALGAAGSVLGTFVGGFVLMPIAGTRAILLGTSGALGVCALLSVGLLRADRPLADTTRRSPPGATPATTSAGYGLLAALVGGAILSLEIGIGRIAADRIGNSVYTWTSVIGVVLLGLAIGNALGGRLADRYAPRPLLSALLLGSSAAVAISLWTHALIRPILFLESIAWPLRTLAAVAAAFLVPSVALGTISPALVRSALADPRADGRTVGRLYALGSLGAVVGAALTGFVLIPGHGVPLLIALLAFLLALAHGKVRGKHEVSWLATIAVLGGVIALPVDAVRSIGVRLGLREDRPGWYVTDSRYFRIRVQPTDERTMRLVAEPRAGMEKDPRFQGRAEFEWQRRALHWRGAMTSEQADALASFLGSDEDRAGLPGFRTSTGHDVRVLILDKLVHGYVDLQDPMWLGYDYEHLYAAVVRKVWPADRKVRAFFIGGGSYTFQRRLVAEHGDHVECVTAEIDPEVTRAGERALGLEPGEAGTIWHGDARTYVDGHDPDAPAFDLVFGDAFNDLSVPWHLTTAEFAKGLRERLGVGHYLINVIDAFDSGRFLGAFLRTLETQFRTVRILSVRPRNDDAQDTFVVVATDQPLDLTDLRDDDGRRIDAVDYGPEDLAALRSRPGPRVLTDDLSPVDTLLAPVVRARGAR